MLLSLFSVNCRHQLVGPLRLSTRQHIELVALPVHDLDQSHAGLQKGVPVSGPLIRQPGQVQEHLVDAVDFDGGTEGLQGGHRAVGEVAVVTKGVGDRRTPSRNFRSTHFLLI